MLFQLMKFNVVKIQQHYSLRCIAMAGSFEGI